MEDLRTMNKYTMDGLFKKMSLMEAFDVCSTIYKFNLEYWLDCRIEEATGWSRFKQELKDAGFVTYDTSSKGEFVKGITLESPPTPKFGINLTNEERCIYERVFNEIKNDPLILPRF